MTDPLKFINAREGQRPYNVWKAVVRRQEKKDEHQRLAEWEKALSVLPDSVRTAPAEWFASLERREPGFRDKEDVYETTIFHKFLGQDFKPEFRLARALHVSFDIGFSRDDLDGFSPFGELPWITSFGLVCRTPKGTSLSKVFRCIPNLRHLHLEFVGLEDKSRLQAIADAPFVSGLRSLSLRWNDFGKSAFSDLLSIFDEGQLESLSLKTESLGQAAGEVLARWRGFSGLNRLKIEHWGEEGTLGPRGAVALAQAESGGLNSLAIAGEDIGIEGAQAIGQSSLLNHIQDLDLNRNFIKDDGLRAILSHPHLDCLQRLNLIYNHLKDSSADLIATHRGLSELKNLRVSNNDFSKSAVARIEKSPIGKQVDDFSYFGDNLD